jgi:hypothetical protein
LLKTFDNVGDFLAANEPKKRTQANKNLGKHQKITGGRKWENNPQKLETSFAATIPLKVFMLHLLTTKNSHYTHDIRTTI